MNRHVYAKLSSTSNKSTKLNQTIKPTLNNKRIFVATVFHVMAALKEHKKFKT